jgi:two-component system nitrogen regulation response regulator GlnG
MTSRALRVLIVDDEAGVREFLSRLLGREGYETLTAGDGEEALALIAREAFDVVLLDIRMPGLDGMEVLRQVAKLDRDLPVIMVTADGQVSHVVMAMREGAYDYLVKPFAHADVIRSVQNAVSARGLRQTIRRPSGRTQAAASLRHEMGSSEAVVKISADVARVACSDFTVLLLGETGTGKDLVARAIHRASARGSRPFVVVDCGAIPETLLESELFGHEKGAFTGADRTTPGKFEVAADGTLFLDEICNMPLGSQAKLLRALQERRVYRVGSTKPIKVESRMLVATNEDLETAAVTGTFRKDLFFRLSEFIIRIPPLRERRQDIVFLAQRFLDLTNQELGKSVQGLSERALERLVAFDWPGNVRQLRSTVRRAVLLADTVIEEEHLGLARKPFSPLAGVQPRSLGEDAVPLKQLVHQTTATVERAALLHALRQSRGNKAEAARLLHIDYKTMHSKVKAYGLGTPSGKDHDEEKS